MMKLLVNGILLALLLRAGMQIERVRAGGTAPWSESGINQLHDRLADDANRILSWM